MRIQVELLEYHGDGLPDDLGLVRMGQLLSINIYLTTGRLLQEIHASHGGGFTGTGGSDDNQLLAFFYFQIYIFSTWRSPKFLHTFSSLIILLLHSVFRAGTYVTEKALLPIW